MSHRISKIMAVTGIGAALAIGGAGVAQANPDHSTRHHEHHACKSLNGKKKRECEKRHGKHHEKNHGGRDGKNHR